MRGLCEYAVDSKRSVYAFCIEESPIAYSADVSVDKCGEPVEKKRLHDRVLVSEGFARFRKIDRLVAMMKRDLLYKKGKVRNAHRLIPLKAVADGRRYLVQGEYVYHHYM